MTLKIIHYANLFSVLQVPILDFTSEMISITEDFKMSRSFLSRTNIVLRLNYKGLTQDEILDGD